MQGKMRRILRNPRFFERLAEVLFFIILPVYLLAGIAYMVSTVWSAFAIYHPELFYQAGGIAASGTLVAIYLPAIWQGIMLMGYTVLLLAVAVASEIYARYMRSQEQQ